MKFLGFEIRKASKQETSQVTAWSFNGSRPMFTSRSKPMLLSTVYRCVDLISDSVAVLPLKTYHLDADGFKAEAKSHPAYYMFNMEPNEDMTRYVFFKTLMASVLLTGNGFAYIERDSKMNAAQLIYLPSSQVTITWITDRLGIMRKRYQVVGFRELVDPRDMIHVLNFSYDGIIGVSTLEHARQSLGIATSTEEHAEGFFKSGASVAGILTVEGTRLDEKKKDQIYVLNFSYDGIIGVSTLEHARQSLGIATSTEEHAEGFFKSGASVAGILTVEGTRLDEKKKDQIYQTWEERTNPITGHPNGIAVLEGNMKYQPISISPKDSQFIESRQFNVVDLCRFFSVSPVKAFDLSKSSYSTVEATQLQYLTDTALAVITKIELEINRKVFLPSERGRFIAEFDTSAILRTDKSAQAAFWKDLATVGAATPNEVRRENNMPRIENGDKAFVQVNVQTLDNAVKEKVAEPQNNPDLSDNFLVSK